MKNYLAQLDSYTKELKDIKAPTTIGQDPKTLTAFIFNTVISISGAIFMIMMLVGAITYLTGAGNDEQTGKAKKIMIDAVIGLVLTLSAYGIGKMVIDALN